MGESSVFWVFLGEPGWFGGIWLTLGRCDSVFVKTGLVLGGRPVLVFGGIRFRFGGIWLSFWVLGKPGSVWGGNVPGFWEDLAGTAGRILVGTLAHVLESLPHFLGSLARFWDKPASFWGLPAAPAAQLGPGARNWVVFPIFREHTWRGVGRPRSPGSRRSHAALNIGSSTGSERLWAPGPP